jgi:F-type H+-transporting ATPase subunit a
MIASGFSWFHLFSVLEHDEAFTVFGIYADNTVIAHAWGAAIAIVVAAGLARLSLNRALKKKDISRYFSDESLTLRTIFELVTEGIRFFLNDMLSKADVSKFLPLIGALFLYIWTCNIIGIIPGLLPPTDNVNTNVGMALVSFLVFMSVGLFRDPIGFLKHLGGPVLFLAPLMFVVEVISLVVRPLALVLRLTGNMFGDHLVFTIMSDMVPAFIPVIFLCLAILVSTIQAFVFSLLTAIYIYLSVPHHEHDEAHAH